MVRYRLIAFSIAVVVLTAALSSCGKDSDTSSASSSSSDSSASTGSSNINSSIAAGAASELQSAAELQSVSSISGAVNLSGSTDNSSSEIISSNIVSTDAITSAGITTITPGSDDTNSEWTESSAVKITFSGSSAKSSGSGVSISGSEATITAPGNYVISGSSSDGQITVNSAAAGTVHIILNGIELTCKNSAPVYVKNADKVVLTVQTGTVNTISDTSDYVLEDASSNEPNAAIFSKSDLTVNGSGTLTVNANYKNGIMSNDTLIISGGKITVNSVNDGIKAHDAVVISDAEITVNANGDGIKATNNSDTSKGFVQINSGSFFITSGTDALQAVTGIIIYGGDFNISSGSGSANSSTKADANQQPGGWGNWQSSADETDGEQSAKAIKAGTLISIIGGNFVIDSSDDSLHSNGNVTIDGGIFSILSGDDGIHADTKLTITGGYIKIGKSCEGLESQLVEIQKGVIDIISSDDGINVAGGADSSANNGRPGQNNFSSSSSTQNLTISGGIIKVNSTGDGLDANGSIYISSGTVTVYGPTANDNCALDYDGVCQVTGGTLVAVGSTGMAQAPSTSSTQYSISYAYSSTQKANTSVKLLDSSGNEILSFTPEKQFQSVVICSPSLKNGSTYKLVCGSTENNITLTGIVTSNSTGSKGGPIKP